MNVLNLLDLVLWPKYRRFLVLGQTAQSPLWNLDTWLRVAESLDPLIRQISPPASVHVTIQDRKKANNFKEFNLPWTKESFAKWCFNSPETANDYRDRRFVDAMVFGPGLKTCEKLHTLPQIFVHVIGTSQVEENRAVWDQEFHLVVRQWWLDGEIDRATLLTQCIDSVSRLANAAMVLETDTRIYSLNQFDSLLHDFNYIGILDSPLPNVEKMKGRWRIVS